MAGLTLENVTERVVAAYAGTSDPRLREVMGELIRHLHAFARKVDLTPEEWIYGLDFLKRIGQISDPKRDETMLMSDILGLSALMDLKGGQHHPGATPSSVLGPFYMPDAPAIPYDADLQGGEPGDPVRLAGRVVDEAGRPIGGASIDFWQTRADGLYDVQVPDLGGYQFRGRMTTQADGSYLVRTIKPVGYTIPTDGPGGELTLAAGRSIWRPAHLHFYIKAEGYRPLITELFPSDAEHIETDAAFGVRDALMFDYVRVDDPDQARKQGMACPFYQVSYDFRLQRSG